MKLATPYIRSCAATCVLLYAIVGFFAGACPSLPGEMPTHQHHHKPITQAFACAWACHVSVGQHAVDAPTPVVPFWLILVLLGCTTLIIVPPRLITISARAPPLTTI